ncbi:divalent-cation tolerance protein CutA [Qipengyuania sp. ASV99]|uniref:divalent-cation tolerance protein CutA n=1 Tax=Qipengyuania sp. ASV99 TaxID=3399681 RepID=UPI003A4C751D
MNGALAALVWCPFPDAASARLAAEQLLADGLIACANILPEVESLFAWEGQISAARETAVMFKTSSGKLATLISRLGELHPYDAPSIIGWCCDAAHPATMNWLGDTLGDT